jgi:surface polysaccharide O-acyltransferase-like enzyme
VTCVLRIPNILNSPVIVCVLLFLLLSARALGRTTIDELTTLGDSFFNDNNLIDAKLVQLYHLPLRIPNILNSPVIVCVLLFLLLSARGRWYS